MLFAGSWNPPHEGHMDILRALVGRHGKVVAWVGENRAKKYTATAAQRAALVRAVVDADPKLRGKVEVVLAEPHTYWSSDFVWRTMYKRGIDIMYFRRADLPKTGRGDVEISWRRVAAALWLPRG